MPSTATTRLRLEKQALGENSATWGAPKLNTVLDLVDEAIGGVESIAIAGTTTTLTSSNYASDQARNAVLVFTGTLGAASSVVVPNVEKLYLVVDNTTHGAYSLTIKTAAGTGVSLPGGPAWVYCDGTNVITGTPRLDQIGTAGAAINMGGFKVTNSATPTATTDLATKAYVDSVAAGGGVDLSAYATKASPTFTGVVTIPLGSVGSPGIAFTGDSNTGIYSSGADAVSLVTAGAARATASTTGLAVTGALSASSTVTAGGVVLGAAGSVSAPSYSFSGDPNTGMYGPGSDILRLVTGGTDRLSIDASGNVGVGYTTPPSFSDHKVLTVKGPASGGGTGSLRVEGGTTTKQGIFQVSGTSGDIVVGTDATSNTTGNLGLYAGGSVRQIISPTGTVRINQTTSDTPGYAADSALLGLGLGLSGNTGRVFVSQNAFSNWTSSTVGSLIAFNYGATAVGNISITTTATSFNTSSDARLKDDIEPVVGACDLVAQVTPKRFRFKSEAKNAKKRAGFLAHEVEKIAPDAVTGKADEIGEDNKPIYQMIDHSKLVPILWAAVAELAARVAALENA